MVRTPSLAERRAHPRIAASASGRVWYGPTFNLWADCKLLDISAGGARIEIPAIYALPRRLILAHTLEPVLSDVILKWQRGSAAGLSFQTKHPLDGPIEPRLSHIAEAWRSLSTAIL